ncbi:PP2C family protein-serine/threonine phosphatase [Actinokineospora diospyrosa]|uniref:Serine/threonine protein phosphatase PrpC n=1 Tax=Actinokineospora diospyrosa TaxID=103728 RepID=A0ABT1ILL1_9PSEU|nr:protein phosphatase 2C domain-containing protein [Actinokineospora diospyrosa]MCP2273408.1 Serine/threonine protein phosphatase PrpC [Actinokineospora diospyrosa]
MIFSAASMTVLGGRPTNEDAAHAAEHLLAVADGVGGAPAGEVASALAIATVVDRRGDSPESMVELANTALLAHSVDDPTTTGMGTTLDLAVLVRSQGRWLVRGAHIGDSVTVVQSDTGTRVLTNSHTLANELIAAGHLTEAEGARHPNRSALVRAVGLEPTIRPDLWELPAARGDRYLLCTDGLTNTLGDTLWPLLASLRTESPTTCVEALVRAASEAGPRDNVTAVVGDVRGGAGWLS